MIRLLLALAALLAAPTPALAATVSVRPAPDGPYDEVHYVAAPGEANRVLVAYAGDARTVTLTDPGATITATAPCVTLDAHTATCAKRPEATVDWLQSTRVELGDGDDEVRSTRPGPAPIGGVIALGGAGDDRLDGGAGSDALDGGGGTDVLLGGENFDVLSDGDRDADAGADVLDGGPGTDTISYAQRSGTVRVAVGGAQAGGAAGEDDALTGFEHAVGGAGNDTLTGDAGPNELAGGPGADALSGGAGDDRLRGGADRDELAGGAGDDMLLGDRGLDALACGTGRDLVAEARAGELLGRRCEHVRYTFGPDREDSLMFAPHPRSQRSGVAVFAIGCPDRELLDGEESACRGTLTLREAGGARRLLGRGALRGELGREAAPVRVALTALGRRLAARRDGVRTTASLAGRRLPDVAWTIPFEQD